MLRVRPLPVARVVELNAVHLPPLVLATDVGAVTQPVQPPVPVAAVIQLVRLLVVGLMLVDAAEPNAALIQQDQASVTPFPLAWVATSRVAQRAFLALFSVRFFSQQALLASVLAFFLAF